MARHWQNILIIVVASTLLCAQLLTNNGRPTTFDGHIHVSTMAMFAQSLQNQEIPAWMQGYANYGYPLALIAHQFPAYFGAVLLMSGVPIDRLFSIVVFITTMTSGISMYFLVLALGSGISTVETLIRRAALASSILYIFSSYRMMNIFSRGALPELFISVITPLLLLAIWSFITKRSFVSLVATIVLSFVLAITHPMLILPVFPLLVAVTIGAFVSSKHEQRWKSVLLATVAVFVGLMMSSYYVMPLLLEIKYFYQGSENRAIGSETFLSFENLLIWNWPYFPVSDHPGPRVGPIQAGIIELLLLVAGIATSVVLRLKKQATNQTAQLLLWVAAGATGLVLALVFSKVLYDHIPLLASMQFPWRFLFTLHFSTSIIAALIIIMFNVHIRYILLALAVVLAIRVPEAYGKNFVKISPNEYLFNIENLHNVSMNPQWVGDTADYPRQDSLFSVIEGTGTILSSQEKSASRNYLFNSDTASRISFNTFYFPGWILRIDSAPAVIEYQDPSYRGVMTIRLAQGQHDISLTYEDTRIRKLAKAISLLAALVALFLLAIFKKLPQRALHFFRRVTAQRVK